MAELKDICDVHLHDEVKVNRIQEEMSQVNISSMSELFKVIGDENRAKIAYALCTDEELCVCDLANIIGLRWRQRHIIFVPFINMQS